MKRLTIFCLIVLCLQGVGVNAESTDWRLEKEADGIRIYTKPTEGSDFRAIRGTVTIQGRLSSLVALLEDMNSWPKLNKIISSAKLHKTLGETESQVYFLMDMPWPVADRDVLYHRTLNQHPETGVVTLIDKAQPEAIPERDGKVRVVKSTQQWTLTPASNGRVDIEWVTHTDPNGPIPAAMVNWLSVGPPFDSVTVLRETIEGGAFADAEIPWLQEP